MSIPRASAAWYSRGQIYILACDVGLVLGSGWLALQKLAGPLGQSASEIQGVATTTTVQIGWWANVGGSTQSSAIALVVVIVSGLAKAGFVAYEKLAPSKVNDLEACLHVLHAMLMTTVTAGDPDPGLRITLHIPLGEEQLEQLCDYVGNNAVRCRNKRRRKTSVKSGIIGDAYRKQEVLRLNRENDSAAEYLRSLEVDWHFTAKEAASVDQTVMSMIAVPLPDNSGVAAILYVDAQRKHFFTDARKQIVEDQCRAIAVFIGKRYSS
jgi:putative methionine-R-sulfoxide reductase with GAF domain